MADYSRYRDDPEGFVREVLKGNPWSKQADILQSASEEPRTTIRSCHGVGKTWTVAGIVLWFLYTRSPCTVITTAPTRRQVSSILWREIRRAHSAAGLPGERDRMRLELSEEQVAFGVATNEPERFQGYHDENILVVVDEASGVSEEIFEAMEGSLTSDDARMILIGNPTQVSGTFYRSHHSDPAWRRHHISAFDSPNFTDEKSSLDPRELKRLITPFWQKGRLADWGEESPAYQIRVLGNFPTSGVDTLVPLQWIERAKARGDLAVVPVPGELSRADRCDGARENPYPVEIGIDVSRFGDCENVAVIRCGPHVLALEMWRGMDLMEVTGKVIEIIRRWNPGITRLDAVGLGAGVYDRLREQSFPVTPILSGTSASDTERYHLCRDEIYWGLRTRFQDGQIALSSEVLGSDNRLEAQLSAIKYSFRSNGQISVESKDEMRRRGLPSPDRADALAYAFASVVKPGYTPRAVARKRGS